MHTTNRRAYTHHTASDRDEEIQWCVAVANPMPLFWLHSVCFCFFFWSAARHYHGVLIVISTQQINKQTSNKYIVISTVANRKILSLHFSVSAAAMVKPAQSMRMMIHLICVSFVRRFVVDLQHKSATQKEISVFVLWNQKKKPKQKQKTKLNDKMKQIKCRNLCSTCAAHNVWKWE